MSILEEEIKPKEILNTAITGITLESVPLNPGMEGPAYLNTKLPQDVTLMGFVTENCVCIHITTKTWIC